MFIYYHVHLLFFLKINYYGQNTSCKRILIQQFIIIYKIYNLQQFIQQYT